jgi:hypothetical protein
MSENKAWHSIHGLPTGLPPGRESITRGRGA